MRYVAVGIGCLECGIETDVLLGFETRALADEWAQSARLTTPDRRNASPSVLWTDDGGQYRVEVHEIPVEVVAACP